MSDMFLIICGAALVGGFWYLLPRNGLEHPLVRNSSVGSAMTLVIMIALTVGVVLMFEGLTG
jgi:phosphatidylglycerophosphate synthase